MISRRDLLLRTAGAAGSAALANLLQADAPHFKPSAKRMIFLFMSGAPSQMELFDYKPTLEKFYKQELPDSVRQGQRLTGMSSRQESFPVVHSRFRFAQHGASGAWVSELLPHTAKIADELCFIKSMHTQQINHDPALTFLQTGFQIAGRPALGSWLAYGIGSENKDLPAFLVMISSGQGTEEGQPLYDRLWSAGFLSSRYQGVKLRAGSDPVLWLSNPDGLSRADRRTYLDTVGGLNRLRYKEVADPEIESRIAQYEMAFRMQASVPDLVDLSKEPASTFELYGEDARKPGTFAANCLLARRLSERGVRCVQLYHRHWDHHLNLQTNLPKRCAETDRASAALITDLKQRGLLDDTLVVWGGEFGRTAYCQGPLTQTDYGRDHHPRCFTIWMAGAGVKPGTTIGITDDYCYNIVEDPVDVHDLHATILHTFGIDHTKLTFKFQGRHYRLTDVHGRVVKNALRTA